MKEGLKRRGLVGRRESSEEAMGRQDCGIFIVMTALGKKYPETRTQPTVGSPEQGMIVGEEGIAN